ncbi:MAG TPA: serine/threonine-protein kinase [Gemmatimonadales bacterium]|jgi:serine/threonine-protein kinase|nr:serine/threonine-protein kinase [Gemmatimonadales bacterium]
MRQDSLVGRTIAGYRLLDHVGEGGTAEVYKAEHPTHGLAAVKVLRARLAQDPTAVKRFLREAEYGRRVVHPNIVQTREFGQTDDLYYLALEWAAGEPLATFVARSGTLAPPLVATIVEQLCGALDAAHHEGIIHRDLKPANIMYDPATQVVKLLDFGIARDEKAAPEERLTRAGFFVGTLQYVAPETLSGALVDERADIYSLATITYYLLTGVLPFPGRTPRELFQQLLQEPPTPLNSAVKGLRFPPAVEAAVMKGLEREADKRYQTVTEFGAGFCAAARAVRPEKKGFLAGLFGRDRDA